MAFITIAGENQIAKKQGDNATLNINKFVLAYIDGLGSEPATRIESIPDAANVVDQLDVTKSGYVNTNQVVYSLVMGSNVGDYDFNWIGLVDDEGILIAVSYVPTIQKRKNDGAVAGNTVTRNFLLAYTGIQQTTAISVVAETWQIDFSARLSGIDERERLSNLDIYGHEGFLADGWKVTGSAGTYSVAAGIGYVGGVRAKNDAAQEITTGTFPNEIWLNVSLQGDISDLSAVAEFVIDTGPFADYTDANGYTHYLTKIATIDAAGDVSDERKNSIEVNELSSAIKLSGNAIDVFRELLYVGEYGYWHEANLGLAGMISFFAWESSPRGFLKANGAEVSRTDYARLFAVIGTAFGVGDGATTFNLPDLRGEFIRAWDDGRGVDSGRGLGTLQNSQNMAHEHLIEQTDTGNGIAPSNQTVDVNGANTVYSYFRYGNGSTYVQPTDSDALRAVDDGTGGIEARPRNMALAAYIKY